MTRVEIIEKLTSKELPLTNTFRLFIPGYLSQAPHISLLPNELLSSIFFFATRDSEGHFETIVTSITVSHVSNRWRNVAISTSALWSTIILTFPTSRQQLTRAVTWLKRSRLAPLDIFLDFRDPSWDWDLAESSHRFRWQDMETILRLLITHAHRWQRFELLTDTWAPIFTFLCYTRHLKSVPLLTSLSLQRCNAFFASKDATFSPVEMRQPIHLFGGHVAEQLREVTLTGVHVDWSASSLRNLTKLDFRYLASDVAPSMVEFTSILTECQSLRHLTILGRGPRIDDEPVLSSSSLSASEGFSKLQKIICLQYVTDFVFGFTDTDYALKLLAKFSFPNLRKLTLECLIDLEPLAQHDLNAAPILDQLLSYHSESSSIHAFPLSRIHSLKLVMVNADTSIMSRFFETLHELDFLGLYKTKNDVLRALTPTIPDPSSKPLPCAALTRLECHDIDLAILVDCMTARGPLSRLARVDLLSGSLRAEEKSRLLTTGVQILHNSDDEISGH